MLILITYDVNTESEAGKRRLRRVAKQCVNFGVRVQNSVFECLLENYDYRLVQHELLKIADLECVVDGAQCRELKGNLDHIIDHKKDSIRIYYLNDRQRQKIECLGVKKGILVDKDTLIF